MDSRKAKKQLKELEKLARKGDTKNVRPNPDPTPTSSIRFDWIIIFKGEFDLIFA